MNGFADKKTDKGFTPRVGQMNFRKHLLSFFSIPALALVFACSGMTPGGAGTGAPGPLDSVANNHAIGSGTTATVGDGNQGQSVPSTQETSPGIGGPCGIGFKVYVRILEGGHIRLCDGTRGPIAEIADLTATNNGAVMAKSLGLADQYQGATEVYEDPTPGNIPRTHMEFISEDGYGTQSKTVAMTCEGMGMWVSEGLFFRFGHNGSVACSPFRASAEASVILDGQNYSSAIFRGPPFPEKDENEAPIIRLTIEK